MQRLTRGGPRARTGARIPVPIVLHVLDASICLLRIEAFRGRYVGHIRATRESEAEPWMVRDVFVAHNARRSGVATALYTAVRRHGRVVSLPGWREGGDSLAWWRAMVARQCAVETEPGVFFLFPKEAL